MSSNRVLIDSYQSLWQARPGGNTRMFARYASELSTPWTLGPPASHLHGSNISRQQRSLSQFCVRHLNKRLRTLLPVSPPVCIGSRGTSGPGWCNGANAPVTSSHPLQVYLYLETLSTARNPINSLEIRLRGGQRRRVRPQDSRLCRQRSDRKTPKFGGFSRHGFRAKYST